jgi:sulfur-carrier protein adenylyltransferase/sulfurtransferase
MPIHVHLPSALRSLTAAQETVALEGKNVQEILQGLTSRHAGLRKHVFSEEGQLRNFVNVYLNDEDVRQLQGVETPVKEGDHVMIVPSIAGGSSCCASEGKADLNAEEIARYSRHLLLPEIGMEGQKKLKASSVLCIGAGGLGSPATLYLAAASVGRIGLVDFDVVDVSNLQRQILYSTDQAGRPKIDMAEERLRSLNPHVNVEKHRERLTARNALDLFRQYDVVIDGTDNFPTRYLVNDACVLTGRPNVYASIFRFDGQVSIFGAKEGPCYRCLYPEPPPPGLVPSCAEGGVLGVLPGTIGTLQALEAVKIITGAGEPLIGRLLLFDALRMDWKQFRVRKNPECVLCGETPSIRTLVDYEAFCGVSPKTAGETDPAGLMTVEELKAEFDRGEKVFLLDVREAHEVDICRIDSAAHIPLGALTDRAGELRGRDRIVVYCKMGGRSARAADILRRMGFKNVINLQGGIDAWAERIDPSVPRY